MTKSTVLLTCVFIRDGLDWRSHSRKADLADTGDNVCERQQDSRPPWPYFVVRYSSDRLTLEFMVSGNFSSLYVSTSFFLLWWFSLFLPTVVSRQDQICLPMNSMVSSSWLKFKRRGLEINYKESSTVRQSRRRTVCDPVRRQQSPGRILSPGPRPPTRATTMVPSDVRHLPGVEDY